MAFQNTPPCTPVTTRDVRTVEFIRADGKVGVMTFVTKTVGTNPDATFDARIIEGKFEYSCGCWWPDVDPGGVCEACTGEGRPDIVCKTHFIVCECGLPCCWRHSRLAQDRKRSLCARCSRREKNKAMWSSLKQGILRLADVVFFKSTGK